MSTPLDFVRYSCGIAGEEIADEFERMEMENIKLRIACVAFLDFVTARGGRWAEMQEILTDALGDGIKTEEPASMPFGDMPDFPTIRGL